MIKGLTSAVLSLAIIFQGVIYPPPVLAASCSKSAIQSGKLKHSGVVTGNSAKVCGRELWKLIPKPKVSVKPIVAKSPGKKVRWKNEFSVTPDRPRIKNLGSLDLAPKQDLALSSTAVRHVRNRMLLWYPTQVRFKPVSTIWDFGDGTTASEPTTNHHWDTAGVFTVRLVVSYSAKYRILGKSEWQLLPGLIAVSSLPIEVHVGHKQDKSPGMVRLVHWDCVQKPNAYGC